MDASVRIALIDRDVPSYFKSLEHLLRYCARPPFALERLSVIRGEDGRISRVCYVLPRHKAANWVGPGRGRKSTRPDASVVVELSPFEFLDRLTDLVPPPRKHRHRPAGGWRGRSGQTSAAVNAAIAWTGVQAVQVTLDGRQARVERGVKKTHSTYVVDDPRGPGRLRVVKAPPRKRPCPPRRWSSPSASTIWGAR